MRPKYGNRKTVVDGITFASAKEASRYGELKLLEKAGEIRGLQLQPRFPMQVNGQHITTYVADFQYQERQGQLDTVEDVKGVQTEAFKIKRKLFEALYGVKLLIT